MTCKDAMQFFGSLSISLGSLFFCFKKPKIDCFAGHRYVRLPLIPCRVPRYTFISRPVVCGHASVEAVLLMSYFPQIANSVVRTNPIDVVNFPKRPRFMGHRPSNPVRRDYNFVNTNFNISIRNRTGAAPFFDPSICLFPCKNSSLAIVSQALFKNIYANFSHEDDISRFLNGGKYACVS